MLAQVSQDRFGCVTISPVNEKIRRKYQKFLRKETNNPKADPDLFLQGDDAATFLQELGTKGKSVEEGWTETIRMDEWEYATMLGYDANRLA